VYGVNYFHVNRQTAAQRSNCWSDGWKDCGDSTDRLNETLP
jgi:hypothetical protein